VDMYEKSRAAYQKVAKDLSLRVIPTGDAFWKISSDPKWSYKKDTEYNFARPKHPQLPAQLNSLHVGYTWTKNKVLKLDANHANEAGCYLGSLTWYGFLFNQSPAKLKFTPDGVPEDLARALRKASWLAVKKGKDL